MTNSSQSFRDFEYHGWQQSVDQYDNSFGSLTNQIIEPLLNAVNAQTGTKILDIATGPGYVAATAAKRQCQVIGLDFSDAMLKKAKQLNPDLEFVQGAAESLPFENEEFDAVVMNFGILHLAEPQKAINEAFRVLRHPGKFAFTVWDVLDKSIGIKLVHQAIQTYGNLEVALPEGPPFFYFSEEQNCISALQKAGFSHPSVSKFSLTWELTNADELFDAFYQGTARTGGFLRSQIEENLANIRNAVCQTSLPYFQSKKNYFTYVCFSGIRNKIMNALGEYIEDFEMIFLLGNIICD